MNYLLKGITNWPERAEKASWSVSELANQLDVSVRTLQRHIQAKMDEIPREWLSDMRQQRALELLRNGATVKEAAFILGYNHQQHFARDFKRYHGTSPREFLELDPVSRV